ncbi:MAG: uroporphyrinogen decarboxylase family protein [Eubacteriales bacterium]|jgi:uroporphyrinogen decarboxylase|nr:uroporphyrinogen decarboxylase family protein [Eubacteriales bacterium]
MGRQLLIDTMKHKKTERAPWVPFSGVHAGMLLGYTATEVLTDADKLYDSVMETFRLYSPDGLPVIFDLQVEAEILGCKLMWSDDCPPSVADHPLEGKEPEIPCSCKLPTEESGRIPVILNAMRRLKTEIGEKTALYGLICGPFTLASHLRGSDIFMDMVEEEEYVTELLDFCADAAIRMIDFYIDAGMDVIAVVDPLVSQISPGHFEEFLTEPFKALFDYIRSKGALSSFFVCGNATRQIENMCKTGPDGISVDENVAIKPAKEISDRYNIAMGGNIPLTTTMLHGTQQDNMKYIIDMLDELTPGNFIVSPGCDMPYHTPVENAVAAASAARNPDEARKMIANYTPAVLNIPVDLPDYTALERPLIEVFTIDSETCAACTYMMEAALDAKRHFGDDIDVIEYKYTIKENIARTAKMGIKNLPTMCVNGEIVWISIIPNRQQLFDRIQKELNKTE